MSTAGYAGRAEITADSTWTYGGLHGHGVPSREDAPSANATPVRSRCTRWAARSVGQFAAFNRPGRSRLRWQIQTAADSHPGTLESILGKPPGKPYTDSAWWLILEALTKTSHAWISYPPLAPELCVSRRRRNGISTILTARYAPGSGLGVKMLRRGFYVKAFD